MWGIEIWIGRRRPIVDAALQRGLLVNRTADTVIRLLPPYIITSEEIDEALACWTRRSTRQSEAPTAVTTMRDVQLRTGSRRTPPRFTG